MDIKPPYGFQEIVPLTKQHRVVLPEARTVPPAFRRTAVLPLSFTEFVVACRDYPIAFVSGDGGASYAAMMVLGLEQGENLFVTPDRNWDRAVYLPAYVRRYPFCMTRITVNGREQQERIACVEKSALAEEGEALHDERGEPLPLWEERRKLLFEYEADLARIEEMCRTLAALQLLETFTVQAVPNEGAPLAMTGVYRVAEDRLAGLAPDKLKELLDQGILARVYAHLISLANFGRLLDRRAAGRSPTR
jgi:hypothetical protein